jgi:hypothetical protein
MDFEDVGALPGPPLDILVNSLVVFELAASLMLERQQPCTRALGLEQTPQSAPSGHSSSKKCRHPHEQSGPQSSSRLRWPQGSKSVGRWTQSVCSSSWSRPCSSRDISRLDSSLLISNHTTLYKSVLYKFASGENSIAPACVLSTVHRSFK